MIDRELLAGFLGASAFFAAVTMPLLFSAAWITVSWAILAYVVLRMAGRIGSEFLRCVSYALYAVTLIRFGVFDLPEQYAHVAATITPPWTEYLRAMIERAVAFGVPIGSLFAAGRLLQRRDAGRRPIVEPANDVPRLIDDAWIAEAAVVAAAGMLFVYLHLELNRTFGCFHPATKMPVLTLLWLAFCGLLLRIVQRRGGEFWRAVLLCFTCGLLVKLFFFDLTSRCMSPFTPPRDDDYPFGTAGLRLFDFGAAIGFFTFAYSRLIGRRSERTAALFFGYWALAAAFIYLTLEVNALFSVYFRGLRPGSISILWSLFALGLLVRGVVQNKRTLRYLGLTLFVVVVGKVFVNDLARLDSFYRIIAFIVLGIVTLCGSFLYLKYRETFSAGANDGGDEPVPPSPGETDSPPQ